MSELHLRTRQLVRLAVERVAGDPTDEQRFLELNFALDRAVERNLQYRELLRIFEEGAGSAAPESGWAWRLAAGLSANLMGDPAAAIRWLEQARAALQEIGRETTPIGSFLHGELARAYYHAGSYQPGMEAANRALQIAHAAGSPLAEAYARHYLGLLSIRRRDYDYARRHIVAARDLCERMGQRQGRARILDSLATLDMEQGRYDSARRLLEESLAVKEELRDLRGQALTCGSLARLHTALGDYAQAMRYLERERELIARVGDERNATLRRIQAGELHLRLGQPERAREELRAAREMACRREDPRREAYACFALAEAERQLGDSEAAREAIRRACDYFAASDDLVMCERSRLRLALLDGHDLDSEAVQAPLDRLRALGPSASLAEALFETATFFRKRGRTARVISLYTEALDAAEPIQAAQMAALMRRRADSVEGRAWVDAMLTVQQQKDRLEQAYADLRRAETLRESLVQMIVHDLKNPLTAITPWLQTIQMGLLSAEETAEYLQMAIDECGYMLRIIEDLNDVGKMQHEGRLELHQEPLALADLLEEVARRLHARARDAGMEVRIDLPAPEALPPVWADRNKLRRVLENLVANALKYGRPPEESGRPAEVRLCAFPEPRAPGDGPPTLRVEVRDHGPGVPLAEADRVFEPYYQAEAGRRRKAGVGLGLAFCRMVILAHGGAIWVEPNPEGGSIFAFRLPVAAAGTA